jgi:hypothetical protein
VICPADHTLKGSTFTFWAFHINFFIRADEKFFKEISALETPEFKDGHRPFSFILIKATYTLAKKYKIKGFPNTANVIRLIFQTIALESYKVKLNSGLLVIS